MATALEPQVTLPWLIRLRWLAVLGQIVAIAVAKFWSGSELPYLLLGALVAIAASSNAALATLRQRGRLAAATASVMGGALVLDTMLLTALLAASGGAMNPFTVLYLVHITLSAVVLSARWTTAIATLSIVGFGSLFLVPMDPHAHHRPGGMTSHLQGMWIAFVLAAGLTAFFVRRVAQAIARQREQIAQLRESSARNARLAAVTTLAAGAAHELGSPLGTIAVAAHEARIAIEKLSNGEAISADLDLILAEVDRCQSVLHQMAARASEAEQEDRTLRSSQLAEQLRAYLGDERAARVEIHVDAADPPLRLPSGQTVQSTAALVRNALDASPPDARVTVAIRAQTNTAEITIEDRGTGIAPEMLLRIGEPFFTTKQPGRGLGLGVFLARAFVESRGGALTLSSEIGHGTRAVISLPMRPEAA